jgi:methyl-accepting chemotaxis protein
MHAIGQIDEVIATLNGASSSIASAAEQQTAATQSIARNLTEAASGVSEITTGITGVARVAKRTSEGAEESLQAATGLAGMAAQLQSIVASLEK